MNAAVVLIYSPSVTAIELRRTVRAARAILDAAAEAYVAYRWAMR